MPASEFSRLASEAMYLVLLLSAPALVASLVVGIAVAVLQAATQVQELTLSFVPKLIAVTVALALGGAWMGREVIGFTTTLWSAIPLVVR